MGSLFLFLLVISIILDILSDRLFQSIGRWIFSLFSRQPVAGTQGEFPGWLYRLIGFVFCISVLAAAHFLSGMFGG